MAEQDRYEPKERLATGLGGERWRALDTRTGTDVVLAVLDARTATTEERARFTLCADASANLSHPGLEKVIDRGTTSLGNPYLVHEIVEAPTFAKRMTSNPPWSIHEIVRVGTSLLDALSVAHSAGLVHGDIEPERVQVLPAGRARITSFGLSRASQRLTDDGWQTSFAFMSPEQANGEPPTAASDVYGVGALLYRAITGITPHAAPDGSASRERIIDDPVAEVRSLRAEIPAALATAIERAVANEPKQRFATAAELRKALTSALILSPTVARMHVRVGPSAPDATESARPAQRTPPPARPASAPAPKPASAAPAPKPASAAPAPKPASAAPAPKPASAAPAPKPASAAPAPKVASAPPVQAPVPVAPATELTAPSEPSVLASDETELDDELIEELEEVTSLPPDESTDAAPAEADAPTASTDTSPSTLARVQVKQVSVQRAAALTEEVASSVRRRDPRAERSNPPPPPTRSEPVPPPPEPRSAPTPEPAPIANPAPTPVAKPAPAPAPIPVAPAAIVSEPPPPPMISRAPMIALSLFGVGALVALLGIVQHCEDPPPVATPDAAPPREIRQPVEVGTAPAQTEAPDAAIAEVVEDAATEAPDASLVVEVPPPVPTPPVPTPPTTASTMTSTPRPPSTMTTTTPSTPTVMTTPPSEMTTPTVMAEPAMVTPMVDTTMRHIEVDPGF